MVADLAVIVDSGLAVVGGAGGFVRGGATPTQGWSDEHPSSEKVSDFNELEKYFRKVSKTSSVSQNQNQLHRDDNADQIEIPSHFSLRQKFDVNNLKADPAERTPILDYHPNIRDEIRRAYIQKRPCQSRGRVFPQTDFFGIPGCFVSGWFDEYPDWLEYSTSANAAYCLPLLLLVATATVERAFSAMKFIKNDLRNRMDDEFSPTLF
ncbi:uncharacterized protein LOC132611761 [Lycium barbarum]|uniref:uncharacterized protein LOC132611761 n=1 Tax=Lycium barbarum TaxID=112863 RepID=UPI00293F24E4|nr:uncharacterized protein LOC132611761 [Lycium barbarum]